MCAGALTVSRFDDPKHGRVAGRFHAVARLLVEVAGTSPAMA
jgi:hypothetical protein